jgi:hypothetical protein
MRFFSLMLASAMIIGSVQATAIEDIFEYITTSPNHEDTIIHTDHT